MSDPETREEIIKIIKEGCTIKSVLKKDKPCPYFGSSGTCSDCSYDWMTISLDVMKVAKFRRASYEKEREKTKALQEKVDNIEETVRNIFLLFGRMGEGVKAFQDLAQCAETYFKQEDSEKEKPKKKEEKKEKQDGNEAGSKGKKSKRRR